MSAFSSLKLLQRSKPIEFDHLGEVIKIYPLSGKCIFQLRDLAPHAGKLLALAFGDSKNDYGSTTRTLKSDDGKVVISQDVTIDPVSTETAKLRHEQKEKAFSALVEFFLSDSTKKLFVDMLWSSLRAGKEEQVSADELLSELSVEDIVSLIKGMAKANEKVLGPFSASLAQATERIKEKVGESLGKTTAEDSGEQSKSSTSISGTQATT